ncbi:D-glycero-beta-D-manno-heptose 1-phosphate adenylyltransferase [candidate division KSB1 bacterium]|nr:D-glycero-beta-D-manno-heptose 1-phosphate adenylyltransferase [candidate division KSB1 bacterium]
MERFEQIVNNFGKKDILVIGDLYLEEYISGNMIGIAKEVPHPVIGLSERKYYPGAAGHVAATLRALGFNSHIIGLIGHDSSGKILFDQLQAQKINIDGVYIHEEMKNNTHLRIIVHQPNSYNQEILRIDTPEPFHFNGEWQEKLLNIVKEKIEDVAAVIVLDKQAKLLNHKFVKQIHELARTHKKLIIGDSDKSRELFQNFDVIVCNEHEAAETTKIKIDNLEDLEQAGKKLLDNLQVSNVVITRGSQGMSIFTNTNHPVHLSTHPQEIYDVTGAGETVTATIAAALVSGASIVEAGRLANYAAGYAVSHPGLTLVSKNDLLHQIRLERAQLDAEKVVSEDELKEIIEKLKKQGKSVAWTNGCFDLMHVGHILYLKDARAQGDLLVVGLNSDESVRMLKGPNRPIVEETQRAKLLASLWCVDYVVVFSDKSPFKVIQYLQPDVYIKGGDYTIDTINQEERRLVEDYGGRIAIVPGIDGMSTTNLIQRILEVGSSEKAEKH